MLGWYCFSMEKLETWIYIQWFWLQIVMVSPGTHLVKSIESQSRNIESQIKKKNIQVCNWKCWGLCVTRQLIWLISLTDSKTLYYCSIKSRSEQIYAFSEQKQSVRIGCETSEPRLVSYGVPHGSILGPTLLNIYINDLPSVPKVGSLECYVDDLHLYFSFPVRDATLAAAQLTEDLRNISTWCWKNSLLINPE